MCLAVLEVANLATQLILREAEGLQILHTLLRSQNEQHKLAALTVLAAAAADSEENCGVLNQMNVYADIAPLFASPNISLVGGALGLAAVLFGSNSARLPDGSLQVRCGH